jgi:hypothetical protein
MKIHLSVDSSNINELRKAVLVLSGIIHQAGGTTEKPSQASAGPKKEKKESAPKQETAKSIPTDGLDMPAPAGPSVKTFEDLQKLAIRVRDAYGAATIKSWYLEYGHGFKKTSDVSDMEPEKPGIIDLVYAYLEERLAKEAEKDV